MFVIGEYQFASKQSRLAQGDKDDNRIAMGGTPGYRIWNLHAGYQLKSVDVQASFINMGNVDYRTHGSGINGQGRSLSIQITYNL